MVLVDFFKKRELQPFSQIEGPLAIQEYIQQVISRPCCKIGKDPQNIDLILKPPPTCDTNSWIYEHVRQFIIELNQLVAFLKPHCTFKTCPIMNVHPENYRCIVHNEPKDVGGC